MYNIGLNTLDPLLHHADESVKSGAVLGIGITAQGIVDEADAAFALLVDYLETNPNASKWHFVLVVTAIVVHGEYCCYYYCCC